MKSIDALGVGYVCGGRFLAEIKGLLEAMENNIPILGRIPFDNELGTLNSDAKIAARESKRYKALFSSLLETVMKEVRHGSHLRIYFHNFYQSSLLLV